LQVRRQRGRPQQPTIIRAADTARSAMLQYYITMPLTTLVDLFQYPACRKLNAPAIG
jgi:hypothetical protein